MKSVGCAALWLLLLVTAAGAQGQELRRVPALVHVHSDRSTGENSYEELIGVARRRGLEALLITEEQILRIEYDVPPFRALTRVAHDERSIFVTGVERYLERIAEARRIDPGVLLIAGVEVLPHYRWVGSPFGGTMILRDHQKNLHVFGVTDPALIRRLPSVANPYTRRYAWQSLLDVLPVLLLIPGVVLLARRGKRPLRVGPAIVFVRRRRWLLGGVLIAVGAAGAVRGWPFTVDRYPSWEDAGLAPQQTLIDEVDRLGGATMWSFPEAFDEGRRRIGPITVLWRTDSHGDDLLRTFRYTAFGAIYADRTRFVEPGGGWDRLLTEYAAGERSRPAWATGEAGAHSIGTASGFGNIQTVFFAREKTEAAVIDAFKRGCMYALQRLPESTLILADFSAAAEDAIAVSGGTLKAREGTPVEVRIAVDASGKGAEGIRVTLIRNGAILDGWSGDTSVHVVHREIFDGRPLVFRIDARGRVPHRLVSNPLFVVRP